MSAPFVRIISLVSICLVALGGTAMVVSADGPAPQADDYAGLKFVLQQQGGFSAYAQITSTFNLSQMRQAFTTIDSESSAYVVGDYVLSGRPDKVKLAVTANGWAIASMPSSLGIEYLFDSYVGYTTSEAEKGIADIMAMAHVTETVEGYYDFRYPQATGATSHWLYQSGNKTLYSTITLPIDDLYLDRGYAFFTAASNSKFWLNDQMIDQQGSIYEIVYRWGKLSSDQLRAGQANTLKQSSLTLFGSGFVAGVSMIYSGTAQISTTGGDRRDYPLVYPAVIGGPLVFQQLYLPLVRN